LLVQPFRIIPNVIIAPGSYTFGGGQISYTLGQQWRFFGTASVEHGAFYDGTRTALGFQEGRLEVTPRLSAEPNVSINWIDVGGGSFTTRLGRLADYVYRNATHVHQRAHQYNSSNSTVAANIRLRWEYSPESEFFVVYNEERDTLGARFPDLTNRALIVKITPWLRL
jgi:hypothetical protein